MTDKLTQFHEYCTKNGIPDSLPCYALWNAWHEAEEKNKVLKFQLDFATRMIEKLGAA
jgi:hypothetical protein